MLPGLLCVLSLVMGSPLHAQDLPNSENIVLSERTNVPIHITYARPSGEANKETPVVILLHGERGNRLVWQQGFAQELTKRGFAVVLVDLRKHGESTGSAAATLPARSVRTQGSDAAELGPNDYRMMVTQDLEAVKRFLLQEHQKEVLNMRKTAIVAADMSCPVAMNFARIDWFKKPYSDAPTLQASTPRGQDIRALVLLSPETNLPGLLPAGRVAADLRNPLFNIAVLIVSSSQDRLDRGEAKKLYQQLTTISENKERMVYYSVPGRFRGTALIQKQNLKVDAVVIGFLEKHLKSLSGPQDVWRNRKSRLLD